MTLGIEPRPLDWRSRILPLNYAIFRNNTHNEGLTSSQRVFRLLGQKQENREGYALSILWQSVDKNQGSGEIGKGNSLQLCEESKGLLIPLLALVVFPLVSWF